MQQIIFDSNLIDNLYLSCPKEYAIRDAKYKVVAFIPEPDEEQKDLELSAANDMDDFLTEDEVKYYMKLR